MTQPISFQSKTIVITGASGGIGAATAELLFELGANLVLVDLRQDRLDDVAQRLGGSNERLLPIAADVSDASAVKVATEKMRGHFTGIDGLLAAAGVLTEVPVAEMSDSVWRQAFSVNVDGVFHVCRELAPILRDDGAIVTVSSIAAHRGLQENAHYAASKGAVLSFTRSLAYELAPRVRVNAISPGIIDTAMAQQFIPVRGRSLLKATPAGRFGSTSEIATVAAFLLSGWASFITGETIHVNGGLYMQ